MSQNNNLILVIEDSPDDYFMIEHSLRKAKIANPIFHVDSGDKALDYFQNMKTTSNSAKNEKPALVLLDLNLPGTDGFDVLRSLKKNLDTIMLPVVILTTSTTPDDIDACYSAGASGYIKKPVDFDGFIKSLSCLHEYWFEISLLPHKDNG